MIRRVNNRMIFLAAACVLLSSSIRAFADSEVTANKEAEDHADLRRYAIELEAVPPAPLVMHEHPVLRWTNPARVEEAGSVFLWLHDGRPQVAGTSFTLQTRNGPKKKHSLLSLALAPVAASLDGQALWYPKVPGISLQLILDAKEPAVTENQRLAQMRSMARKFTVELFPPNDTPTVLRLVPQPLYRYSSPNAGVTDGALFSYAVGTDPEAFLLMEAREHERRLKWHYAFGRFTYWPLKATYEKQQVWTAERLPIEGKTLRHAFTDLRMRDRTYISFAVPITTD